MEKRLYKDNLVLLGISIVVGGLFILLCSPSISILNNCNFGSDSAWIQLIAKYWIKGYVPYIDTFDHKGPLYFLIDGIGYLFPNTRLGLFLVESLMMSAQIFIVLATVRYISGITKKTSIFAIIMVATVILFYSYTMCDGGLSEEYSNLFLLISLQYIIRYYVDYYRKGIVQHSWRGALLYGISFGAISMIRINNALVMCVCIAFIIGILIKNAEWKCLIKNGIAAAIGVVLVVLPFVIYYALKGGLYDFWYSAFLYNFNYMKMKEGTAEQILRRQIFYLVPEFVLLFSGIVGINRKKYLIATVNLSVFLILTYMLMSGAQYTHYFMLGIPTLLLSYLVLFLDGKIDPNRIIMKICLCGIALSELIVFIYGARNLPRKFEETFGPSMISEKTKYNDELLDLVNYIPENELDQVAAYNIKGTQKSLFLVTDIAPRPKYILGTEKHALSYTYSVMTETMNWFYSEQPKWIIMPSSSEVKEMLDFINEKYELAYSVSLPKDDDMLLYRKK